MSYQIYQLENEPIVVVSLEPGFNIRDHSSPLVELTIDLLDQQSSPVSLIMDIRDLSLDLDDLLFGTNLISRQFDLFKHPNVAELILVSGSRVIKLSAQGLQSPHFGSLKMEVVKTLDDALAYARR